MTIQTQNTERARRKGDKRERTKAAILKAAGDLIRDGGYEQATLEAIAAKAGMSRGAIYGNYENRDALFAAVALERWHPIVPDYVAGSSFKSHMRRLGRAYFEAARERTDVAAYAASFQMQTRQHEHLRQQVMLQGRRITRQIAEELKRLYPQEELKMPAERLIKVLGALGEGLMSAYFVDPEGYGEQVFISAFEAFAV